MKKKVVVIMGGISSEREVSLNSGKSVLSAINRDKYDVHELIIDEPMDVVNKMPEGVDFALLIPSQRTDFHIVSLNIHHRSTVRKAHR